MNNRKYFCEDCQKEVFGKLTSRRVNHCFRKESFEMTETVKLCNCGYELYDEDLINQTMKKLIRLYEDRVGLGSEDIKEIRMNSNLSMELFARILGWSKATIVRYESGQNIPDVSHQAILKLMKNTPNFLLNYYEEKKDSFTAKEQSKIEKALKKNPDFDVNTVAEELVQYQAEKGIPNVLNGYTEFDFEKVANMVLFFSRVGINKTKLMKCLFYADFLFHKRYTNSISGLKYKKLQYGPVPERHGTLLERIEERNFISVENTLNGEFVQIIVKANEELNPELFNDCELEVLEVLLKNSEILIRVKSVNFHKKKKDG